MEPSGPTSFYAQRTHLNRNEKQTRSQEALLPGEARAGSRSIIARHLSARAASRGHRPLRSPSPLPASSLEAHARMGGCMSVKSNACFSKAADLETRAPNGQARSRHVAQSPQSLLRRSHRLVHITVYRY